MSNVKKMLDIRKQMKDLSSQMNDAEANEYMDAVSGFNPRMFKIINTVSSDAGVCFGNYYSTVFSDGALSQKIKELMFMSGGVGTMSSKCIVHVIPACENGATILEVFEAATVGVILGGFSPRGAGIPYAFDYALKCIEGATAYHNELKASGNKTKAKAAGFEAMAVRPANIDGGIDR
ncbi:MAG: hypothetical protein OEV92_04920 [Nitrospinota bacterium]|nr:hypothetical protein [Nitrospinota bacterium]